MSTQRFDLSWLAYKGTTTAGWDGSLVTGSDRDIPLPIVAGTGSTAYSIIAAQGSFTLTGQTVTLTSARTMAAAQGSYSLTGNSVTLATGKSIIAGQGAFTLTGNTVSFVVARNMPAAQGSFALNGQSAILTYTPASGSIAYSMTAAVGSFSLTGESAALSQSAVMRGRLRARSRRPIWDIDGVKKKFRRRHCGRRQHISLPSSRFTISYPSRGYCGMQ